VPAPARGASLRQQNLQVKELAKKTALSTKIKKEKFIRYKGASLVTAEFPCKATHKKLLFHT
jgi:hypothetical protein